MASFGRTALYRAFAKDGTILYIGISATPMARMGNHRNSSPWYRSMASHTVEWFGTRKEAMAAERRAVWFEKPLHNRQLRTRAPKSVEVSPTLKPTQTPPRQIRIDDRWYDFEKAVQAAGKTRAEVINEFIVWYLRAPKAKAIRRPERDAWLPAEQSAPLG